MTCRFDGLTEGRNRKGYGKIGKRKAAFQLSHSHDYYEIHSAMGYGFKGQGHDSLRLHWPEYLMEAVEGALYLFLTCVFASLLLYPASPVRSFLGSTGATRALMGLAVG